MSKRESQLLGVVDPSQPYTLPKGHPAAQKFTGTFEHTDPIEVAGPQEDIHMARIAKQIALFAGPDTDVRWVNIIDLEHNPDGKFGSFRMSRRTA